MSGTGTLRLAPVLQHLDLVAPVVASFLTDWAPAPQVQVAIIDPSLSDTAAFCDAYDVGLDVSGNCVVVAGSRGGETRLAACVVLATTRADVNNVVRRRLDARKASFAPMDDAVERTGMEHGAITPIGLPADIPLLVDSAVFNSDEVVVGSGVRGSKLVLPGLLLGELPNAEVVQGLATSVS
jgi:prolyl-tRNA editing enzyme YbaK/EbsC (Cys-tRNA(Pro) deacylase)